MKNLEVMRHIQTNIGLLECEEREQLINFIHKLQFEMEINYSRCIKLSLNHCLTSSIILFLYKSFAINL